MEKAERDIDYVLITGAGASCAFGINGGRLPLMGDWANALVKKLGSASSGYLKAIGLHAGLSPAEFEERLGAFNRRVAAFAEIEPLVAVSREFPHSAETQRVVSPLYALEGWHSSTKSHLDQIVELIRESLYELFADPSLDIKKAADSYGGLFRLLGITDATPWVYATTNYDPIGERVIEELGWRPDWGQPPQANTSGQRLDVDGVIRGIGRYVPVLHLHGRVHWYRRTDGLGSSPVYAAATPQHQAGFGVPIVMLPDPNKAYASEPVISSLWTQFEETLRRTKRVFVLGHSLNDETIVQALTDNVEPLDRIAVTVLVDSSDPEQPDESAIPVLETIRACLGNAAIVPMRFGDGPDAGQQGIQTWLQRSF